MANAAIVWVVVEVDGVKKTYRGTKVDGTCCFGINEYAVLEAIRLTTEAVANEVFRTDKSRGHNNQEIKEIKG